MRSRNPFMPKSASVTYRIGEVAAMATVSVAAVRYYERIGLLPHPPRTDSGRRRFTAAAVDRIRFVKRAQRNGLALGDIRELVGFQSARMGHRCRQVHQLLERKLAEIDRRRAELDAFRKTLQAYADECAQSLCRGPDPECPVIDHGGAEAENDE
jgi:MerR family transcriptional regulator, copper efflux regulator